MIWHINKFRQNFERQLNIGVLFTYTYRHKKVEVIFFNIKEIIENRRNTDFVCFFFFFLLN